MKCNSCAADIPPQWVHSINTNTCPGCGSELMDTKAQNILAEVREAMNQMPANPEGLAGWLLSNYKLTKVGAAEPSDFHQRVSGPDDSGSTRQPGQPKAATPDEGTLLFQKFLKRTGVKMPDVGALKKTAGTTAIMDIDNDIDDMDDSGDVEIEGNELPFTMPGTAAGDPHAAMKAKQKGARNAILSGAGGFRRS